MKNFYDSTVIKPNLKLDVVITLTPVGQCPCRVLINKELIYNDVLTELATIQHNHPLTESLAISISMVRTDPEAIIVDITIDGYPIIPIYQQYALPPTNYLHTNEQWTLTLPNFYPWYHEITGQGWIV